MSNRRIGLIGVMLSASVAWAAVSAPAQKQAPREDYNSGAYLYRTFCASCHGEAGRGDGPVADITTPRPSDLTVLSRRAGGVFPRDEVMAILNGSTTIRGHESGAMPNWRDTLKRTEGANERVIQQRLDALASHIESLQVKD